MLSSSQLSKISRKQKRCQAIVTKETGIRGSDSVTKFLGICNAGLSTGLQEEIVIQEALKYGQIDEVVMIPNKSYCFLRAHTIDDALSIYSGMHGISKIGQGGAIVYLAYFVDIPKVENPFRDLPPGLIIINDFVDNTEEELLLKSVLNNSDKVVGSSLKHRIVKHFGYEFLYGSNQVDPDQPLERKIPKECDFLWTRLKKKVNNLEWYEPDQLTVNEYFPGQGIPPHVDTHSAFLDPLLVVSLEGTVVMEFKHEDKKFSVVVPRRSLLLMSGESRYDWTHGITPRFMDVIPREEGGGLTVRQRTKRTSLTFRKLRRGPCTCNYPRLCDSRQTSNNSVSQGLKNCARELESENVHKVYDEIASHFSRTRHSPWPKVSEFINSFDEGCVIVDIGCGNGKYLGIYPSVAMIGCDRSKNLLDLCIKKNYNVFRCDCLNVPFRNSCVDGCISIAVIHHLATENRRLQAVKEMIRILRPGGRGLIYVWAKNQEVDSKKSNYLRQGQWEVDKKKTISETNTITKRPTDTLIELPVHVNRTRFKEQDVFVPWKLKNEGKDNETFLRYYHVFEENELGELCKSIGGIEIENSYYDEGNWCIVFRKL